MLLNCGVGEESWESLYSKETKPVTRKGNQSWIFIGRTDAEAETPILWPPDSKNWLFEKDHDAGKEWMLEEKGTTEDVMVGWYHRLNGQEFEESPCLGNGQGSLACAAVHGVAKSRTRLSNWTETSCRFYFFHIGRILFWQLNSFNLMCKRIKTVFYIFYHLIYALTFKFSWCLQYQFSSVQSLSHHQPFHPLSSPSPSTLNLSQHQGLFKWVSSSQQVAKVFEFQLQHQSFQWIFTTDFL